MVRWGIARDAFWCGHEYPENLLLPSGILELSVQTAQEALRRRERWLCWSQPSRMQGILFTVSWRQERRCSACLKRCSGPCRIRLVSSRCTTGTAAVRSWNGELDARALHVCEAVLCLFAKKYESGGAEPKTMMLCFCL